MLSFASFMIFGFSLSTVVPQEQNVIETWLSERILEPEETRHEMGGFIEARIPPLSVPETAVVWQGQSDRLRRQILDTVVFRGVPREWVEWKSEVLWGDTLQTEKGYRIRKLRYEALPGLWIPALLYEPIEIQGKVPAILNVNGHVGPKGKAIEYEQIRCINLAKRGMLALHPEWLVFGELEGFDYKHNRLAYLDLCGLSGLAVFYLAMRGGVDVLLDYPSTDPQRLAMTGLSGGGWQTILLSALDTRISTIVPNAGYIGLESRVVHRGDIGDLEQNPTDLVSIADYPHLTAMLAPRPALLIYNEKDDCCFVSERARPSVYDPVIPFYRLFGAEGDFEYHENRDPGTHNYDQDNRQQFYRFVHRQFFSEGAGALPLPAGGEGGGAIDQELPSDAEALDPDQLRMGLPEANANFFTLARERLSSLPKHPVPTNDPVALQRWQVEARSRLRDVLRLKPMAVEAAVVQQAKRGEGEDATLEATWYKLTIGGGWEREASAEWTVPAVVMSEGKPKATAIVFADAGRATLSSLPPPAGGVGGGGVKELLAAGSRVIAVDPLFMGECIPQGVAPWQFAQMIATVGERPLGMQVGQVGAVIRWACQQYGAERVSLHANGWTAGIVALAAAGLNPEKIERVVITGGLSSLKRLIEDHLDYEQYPTLFCFGLLEQFDMAELVALCSPQMVEFR